MFLQQINATIIYIVKEYHKNIQRSKNSLKNNYNFSTKEGVHDKTRQIIISKYNMKAKRNVVPLTSPD